jgi:hypothetical protein
VFSVELMTVAPSSSVNEPVEESGWRYNMRVQKQGNNKSAIRHVQRTTVLRYSSHGDTHTQIIPAPSSFFLLALSRRVFSSIPLEISNFHSSTIDTRMSIKGYTRAGLMDPVACVMTETTRGPRKEEPLSVIW